MNVGLETSVQAALAPLRAEWGDRARTLLTDFEAELTKRLAAEPDAAAALEKLLVPDLFLAFACARGDERALTRFHTEILDRLPALVGRGRATEEQLNEVQQRLVDRLLLSEGDRPPGIATYEGRAPLASWVRVAAVRAASNVRRDRATYEQKTAEAPLPLAALDPEIAALKRRFGEAFKRTFQGAFASLAQDDRTLLRLHFLDGLAVGDAARVLNVSRATAYRRLNECRLQLVEEVLRRLGQELSLPKDELESLYNTVRSKLSLSLGGLLAEP
ncbi:MAG: hypothetical protein JST92_07850 [Deltaproteobacteria bacterium]|nr:hypothetical protein [Deltaproteobacteria bacterium]